MVEKDVMDDITNFLCNLSSGQWEDLDFTVLDSKELKEIVQELKNKFQTIEQLILQFNILSKIAIENFTDITTISEKSAMKIVNSAEELMNIQSAEDLITLQDKAFQIITSVEFQDIIQQKIDLVSSQLSIIKEKTDTLLEKFPFISQREAEEISVEKEKLEKSSEDVLTNQDLVDQLLAEFGIQK